MALNNNSFSNFLSGDQWGSLSPSVGQMVLTQMPQAQYMDYAQRTFGDRGRKSRFAQQAYGDVYNQYLGEIGRSLREGQTPATFKDFLDTDPFTKRYSQLPQFERGVTKTMTNPRTRFIFY